MLFRLPPNVSRQIYLFFKVSLAQVSSWLMNYLLSFIVACAFVVCLSKYLLTCLLMYSAAVGLTYDINWTK